MFNNDSVCGTTVQFSFSRYNSDSLSALDMWADSIVDDAGYASTDDLIMSRLPLMPHAEEVERLFPTADELRARGVDVVKLAACMQEEQIICEFFNDDINALSVDELNDVLEHLLEQREAFRAHPKALDRIMHRHACCNCSVA